MVSSSRGSALHGRAVRGGLRFHHPDVLATRAADGSLLLWCARPQEPLPDSLLTWFAHWAAVRPARVMLAQRRPDGRWRRVTYRQAWSAVRSLGRSLLRLGAHEERPVAILSENSIEHALMTWAAHYAGVP